MVVGSHSDDQRHLLDHVEAELTQLRDLVGVVRQQTHLRHAQVGEDAGGRGVVAGVGGQPQREVGIDRVEALLLQAVRAQLVDEADPRPRARACR